MGDSHMATAFSCTTPAEGWGLYGHFLGNYLLSIAAQDWDKGEETQKQKDKRERDKADDWLKLLGAVYMISDRMEMNGHPCQGERTRSESRSFRVGPGGCACW